MRMLLARGIVLSLVVGPAAMPLLAQERRKSEEPATKSFKLLKAPETPAELWDAAKFSMNVGQPDEAAKYLDRLLASNPPVELLITIRERDAATYFPKLAATAELYAKGAELVRVIEKAARERARDPERIQKFIGYLTQSAEHRGYGIAQLRSAGADAVPHLLGALRDPSLAEHHPTILYSMQKLDTTAVPPLVAALATEDTGLLSDVIQILSVLGDADTVPHLRYVAESSEKPKAIQSLARSAVNSIVGVDYGDLPSAPVSLVSQARRYYEHRIDLRPTVTNRVRLWRWDPREGLKSEEVTPSYAEEFFGLEHCRQALRLNPNNDSAQILMLSLAMEKAAERVGIDQSLPEGPERVSATAAAVGPELLSQVLVQALDEGHPLVAVESLRALAQTGSMNLLSPRAGRPSPLVQALTAPDRRTQFAAAEAVLSLRPQQAYPGTSSVVPILTRSLVSDGNPKALIVDIDATRGGALASLLREAGYESQYASNAREGFAQASESADFEVILLDPNIQDPNLTPSIATFRADPRTAGIPIIVLGEVPMSMATDPVHESIKRGDLTKALEELSQFSLLVGRSKIDASSREDVQDELHNVGNRLQSLSKDIGVPPGNRAFLAYFVSRLKRVSAQIEQSKSDKAEKDALQTALTKLTERIQKFADQQAGRTPAENRGKAVAQQNALAKFERLYPRVKVFQRPTSMEMLKLQLEPMMAGQQSKPLTAAERSEYARRSAAWLARIARGEIRGIDLAPAESAVVSVLSNESLGLDAIVAASLLPSAHSQSALAHLILNESANMTLRLAAAKQISRSLRQFGVLLAKQQAADLLALLDRTEDPAFHQALAVVMGAMKPRGNDASQRLRRYATPRFDEGAAPPAEPPDETPRANPPAAPAAPAAQEPAAKEPPADTKTESNP